MLEDGATCTTPSPIGISGGRDVKLHYYPETDSLYVEFQSRPSVDTREVTPDVRLDHDDRGRPVGLDIDHASEILDLELLETVGLPAVRSLAATPRPVATD
jgi:uncharacterized protein YuzE